MHGHDMAQGRVRIPTRPRFMKEGALFNAQVEMDVPGPGTYDAEKAYSLQSCKIRA